MHCTRLHRVWDSDVVVQDERVVANEMRGERNVRQAQLAGSAVVWKGEAGHPGGGKPRWLPEIVQSVVAMGGRDQVADQLQVDGPDDRDSVGRLHRGLEGGQVCLVSRVASIVWKTELGESARRRRRERERAGD